MHSLRSAAVQYTNYGTGGAFELPTQSGTSSYKLPVWYSCTHDLDGVITLACTWLQIPRDPSAWTCKDFFYDVSPFAKSI